MAKKRKNRKTVLPTAESTSDDQFNSTEMPITRESAEKIVNSLNSYKSEAKVARASGPNDRDNKWRENLDLYWNRYDFSKKKGWQAKEVMPEVPSYVDRFSAALKEALINAPGGFYTVLDPADEHGDMTQPIKRALDVWLSRSGRNQMGQLLPYSAVFEEQVKLGAIMASASVTTWKEDVDFGRVAIETVDPRTVWLDPTYRNLYRLRTIEMDRHSLKDLAIATDDDGNSLYNLPEVSALLSSISPETQSDKENLAGHGVMTSSGRNPVTIDEYIATVVDEQGNKIADRGLFVVANDKFLIRGPEKNPFWHGQDWLVFSPLITVPLSVYGRSYMEDFGSISKTFTELTNLLLDAVHVSALRAFAVVPEMLINPGQLAEGITPNKMFQLELGFNAKDFAQALELGTMSPEGIKMWEILKNELTEAARVNEIGLGQFAPKGRTSATEINSTQESSSALIRSVAQTIETRVVETQLDLAWKTGMQHVHDDDERIRAAMGDQMFEALIGQREAIIRRPFTFQARGISELLRRAQMLKTLLTIIQVISANQYMAQEFFTKISMEKLVVKLFEFSNIDLSTLQTSERERLIQQATGQLQQAAQNAGGARGTPGPGASQGGAVAQALSGQR